MAFKEYLKSIVSMNGHLDKKSATDNIRKNIEFKGPNVLILACAIIIASVGLNVNSIPVIIGAMLISPVMGPLMGTGLSLGTNDTELLKRSLQNFLTMVVISILASALFFVLSPLRLENPTELLARTRPTIYDVLIALFGGIAGMLEMTRKEKGTVLSGVAIATALMPPLCTIGYGVAHMSARYIFGAAYLFLINGIFIVLAVFLMTKYLGFKSVVAEDQVLNRKRSRIVGIVLAIIMVPSVISAINIVQETNFSANASRFVKDYRTMGQSYIIDSHIEQDGRKSRLDIYLAGEKLKPEVRDMLLNSLASYGIREDQLAIHDEATIDGASETELMKQMYEYYGGQVQDLNRVITELQVELARYRSTDSTGTAGTAGKSLTDSTGIR